MIARWEAGRVASSCWESITAVVWSQIANTKQIQIQGTDKYKISSQGGGGKVYQASRPSQDQARLNPKKMGSTHGLNTTQAK